uniref:Proline rich 14 n=1 Tax=Sphenodon punctatus TaxID=8508 RepID=A0A8D0H5W3_SPHPU
MESWGGAAMAGTSPRSPPQGDSWLIPSYLHVRCRRPIADRPTPLAQGSPTPCRELEQLQSERQQMPEREGEVGAGRDPWITASPMEKEQRRVLAVSLWDCTEARGPEISQSSLPSWGSVIHLPETPVCRRAQEEGGIHQISKDQRIGRRRVIVYKPSPEDSSENGSCSSCWGPLETSPHLCQESTRLHCKRQRLQQEGGKPRLREPGPAHSCRRDPPMSLLEEGQPQAPAASFEDCVPCAVPNPGLGRKDLALSPNSKQTDQLTAPLQSTTSLPDPTPSSSSQWEHCPQADLSPESPVPPPPRPSFRHWRIAPVLQTMKSKLEAFADIFLSPAKPPEMQPPPAPLREESRELETARPHQRMNIEVKIAISEPRPCKRSCEEEAEGGTSSIVTGRPPIRQWRLSQSSPAPRLGRSYSCPNISWTLPWRTSPPAPSLSAAAVAQRRRRHTVCSMEVARELGGRLAPPCLRKEVYPLAALPARLLLTPIVQVSRCDESSSPSPMPSSCLDPHPTSPRNTLQTAEAGKRTRGSQLGTDSSELLDAEMKTLQCSRDSTAGKVSRFRIRKTPAKQQAHLTPMGLPRPVRLNKKTFSLEEIYTNKNYQTPTDNRSLETIFEEPAERNGTLVLIGHRKLKRFLRFQDDGLPRKQRRGRGCRGRGRRAPPQRPEMEEMLQQRMAELDVFIGDCGEAGQ